MERIPRTKYLTAPIYLGFYTIAAESTHLYCLQCVIEKKEPTFVLKLEDGNRRGYATQARKHYTDVHTSKSGTGWMLNFTRIKEELAKKGISVGQQLYKNSVAMAKWGMTATSSPPPPIHALTFFPSLEPMSFDLCGVPSGNAGSEDEDCSHLSVQIVTNERDDVDYAASPEILEVLEDPSAPSPSNLLNGVTFYIGELAQPETEYAFELIVKNGAQVMVEDAHVAILPIVCTEAEMGKAEKAFTIYWLIDCIQRRWMDFEETLFFYKPNLQFKKMEKILQHCSIVIGRYDSAPARYLIGLIIAMGGTRRCTGKITIENYAQNGLVKSTHVIFENLSIGMTTKAKQMMIPVVSKNWILDCYENRACLPTVDYELELEQEEQGVAAGESF